MVATKFVEKRKIVIYIQDKKSNFLAVTKNTFLLVRNRYVLNIFDGLMLSLLPWKGD